MHKTYTTLVVVLILLIHVTSLMMYPAPFCDEFWFLARTIGFMNSGTPFGALDFGVFNLIAGHQYFFSLIPHLFYSIFVYLLGPDLLAMRITTLLFGLYTLLIYYSLIKKVTSDIVARNAVVIFSLSLPFFISSHLSRLDIMATAFLLTGTRLLLTFDSLKPFQSILAGILIVFGYDCHPHSAVMIPPLVFLSVYNSKTVRLGILKQLMCAVGLIIGVFLYYYWHILPEPNGFKRLLEIAFAPSHTPPILTFDLHVVNESFIIMSNVLDRLFLNWELVLVSCLILVNKNKKSHYSIWVCLISLMSYILLVRHKVNAYYFIYFAPFLYLFVSEAITKTFTKDILNRTNILTMTLKSLILIPIFIHTYNIASRISWSPYLAHQKLVAYINSEVSQSDKIMGSQVFWSNKLDIPYYSWEGLIYYSRAYPNTTLLDAFLHFKPTILIIDSIFRDKIVSKSLPIPISPYLSIPKEELDEILRKNATKVTRVFSDFDSTGIDIINLKW